MAARNHSSDSSDALGGARASDFITLLKPRVMTLVVFSALCGIVIAPVALHPFLVLVTLIATALASGGAACFNMWYDRDIDALMARTADRPIVRGVVSPSSALGFSVMLSVGSVMLMALALNISAALVLLGSIFYYAFIYTVCLKRLTSQNIVIGGAAGAFPPLVGYMAAAPDQMTAYPWVLFAIIFLWTPPHFWSLAMLRQKDYAAARVPMLPVQKGNDVTIRAMLMYTLLLWSVSLIPAMAGWTGMLYGTSAFLLGGWFGASVWHLYRQPTDAAMRRCFRDSVIYLFALFTFLMMDELLQV